MSARQDELDLARRAESLLRHMQGDNHADDSDVSDLPIGVRSVLQQLSKLPHIQPTPEEADATTEANLRFGRFQLSCFLGEGAHGVVYLADDTLLDRIVALKLPQPYVLFTPKLRERFLREARAASKLHHPHVVQIYDASAADELCFIASEYCAGGTLDNWLQTSSSAISERTAAALIADLANAVEHAHQNGILHRDIKPRNILLIPIDECSSEVEFPFLVKLTDFGLAKALTDPDPGTRSGELVGTVRYMAPEQIDGTEKVSPATDVYALGTVLYLLLSGQLPFDGDSDAQVLRRVVDEPPVEVKSLANVSADLAAICMKCIEKKPSDRYESAAALANDLQRFLNGEQTIARPIGQLGRFCRWAKRNPAYAALFSLFLVAAICGLSGLSYHNWRLGRALEDLASEKIKSDVARGEAEASATIAEARRGMLEERQRTLTTAYYAADMNLAFQAFHSQLPGLVAQSLQRHEYDVEQFDPRGFEWNYLDGIIHPKQSKIQIGTADSHLCRVFGSNELLISDGSTTLQRFDVSSNRQLSPIRLKRPVREVAVCPVSHRIAVAHGGPVRSTVSVYLTNGNWQMDMPAQAATIESLAFSPDGRFIAAGSRYSLVNVWDLQGKVLHSANSDSRNEAIAFSPDSRLFAYSVFSRVPEADFVKVLDTADWSTVAEVPIERKDEVFCFDPHGKYLAVSNQFQIFLYNTDDYSEITNIKGGRTRTDEITFTDDGEILLAVSKAGVLRFWELDSLGTEKSSINVLAKGATAIHTGRVNSLVPAGPNTVATVGQDGRAVLTNFSRSERLAISDSRHSCACLCAGPDGQLAAAMYDGRDCIWLSDGTTREFTHHHYHAPTSWHRKLALSSDGRRYASFLNKRLVVTDLMANRILVDKELAGKKLLDIDFVTNEMLVVVQEDTSSISFVRIDTGELQVMPLDQNATCCMKVDNRRIAIATENDDQRDHEICIYDVGRNDIVDRIRTNSEAFVIHKAGDGSLLASGNHDGTVDILTTSPLRIISKLDSQRPQRMGALAFSPDNKTLLSGNKDGSVQMWQVSTGRELGTLLKQLGSSITGLAIDQQGQIVCGFSDGNYGLRRFGAH